MKMMKDFQKNRLDRRIEIKILFGYRIRERNRNDMHMDATRNRNDMHMDATIYGKI